MYVCSDLSNHPIEYLTSDPHGCMLCFCMSSTAPPFFTASRNPQSTTCTSNFLASCNFLVLAELFTSSKIWIYKFYDAIWQATGLPVSTHMIWLSVNPLFTYTFVVFLFHGQKILNWLIPAIHSNRIILNFTYTFGCNTCSKFSINFPGRFSS